jgi:HPt (histidine-containing phosphotransfer) domain-containing protein
MDRAAYLHRVKQHLQTAYLLNEERAEAMIPVFITTLRGHMDRLAELAAEGDLEQLGRASHAVKGALLNIGLSELAETASTLEQQCKTGTLAHDHQAMIAQLHTSVARFGGDW